MLNTNASSENTEQVSAGSSTNQQVDISELGVTYASSSVQSLNPFNSNAAVFQSATY
jgi:hypothetical protein